MNFNLTSLRTLYAFALIIAFFPSVSNAQSLGAPLDITPFLSGNFGELRNNHFHSGIDFKTQSVINKPIYSVADGYVSRISVSPSGYGLALYINHPAEGYTSVYGHLNSFAGHIAEYVKQKQYEKESFRVNLILAPDEIVVRKGERVAMSGNTGSSGGPHLHFEIRDTKSEDPIDPLNFYGHSIADTRRPDIRAVAFYPIAGRGAVNGKGTPLRLDIGKTKEGATLPLSQTVTAWGRIGVGVKAYDRMTGQNNIYGVKYVRLFLDGEQIFGSELDRISFDKTRMLNTFIDFEEWRERSSFFMRSFIEPGNTLPVYNNVRNRGYIDIDEERVYNLKYELEDAHGNKTVYSFSVEGRKQEIPRAEASANYMAWNIDNYVTDLDFVLLVPSGNLYNDIFFKYDKRPSAKWYSDTYQINETPVPLHNRATMWIGIKADTLENKEQYGVVSIDDRGRARWVGGSYKNGGVEFTLNEFGHKYAVDADTIKPTVAVTEVMRSANRKGIKVRLSDDKSGIERFRGTINGEFVLFTHDAKSNIYTYIHDKERRPDQDAVQELLFTAWDYAGNRTDYSFSFSYTAK